MPAFSPGPWTTRSLLVGSCVSPRRTLPPPLSLSKTSKAPEQKHLGRSDGVIPILDRKMLRFNTCKPEDLALCLPGSTSSNDHPPVQVFVPRIASINDEH